MIDVFICTATNGPIRRAFARAVMARWSLEREARLRLVVPRDFEVDHEIHKVLEPETIGMKRDYQRERRMYAEERAASDYYVCADDDCLPLSFQFLTDAVSIMKRYPQFAILTPWPTNATIHEWRPATAYKPYEDDDVMEHFSVGGIRVCRKGALREWPELGRNTVYDAQHCMAVRRAGYRAGLFRAIRYNHLGESYSTVLPNV